VKFINVEMRPGTPSVPQRSVTAEEVVKITRARIRQEGTISRYDLRPGVLASGLLLINIPPHSRADKATTERKAVFVELPVFSVRVLFFNGE
jgi:hypothetical protein